MLTFQPPFCYHLIAMKNKKENGAAPDSSAVQEQRDAQKEPVTEEVIPPEEGDKTEEIVNSEEGAQSKKEVAAGDILTKKQKVLRTLLQWTLMSVGCFMMACSVYFFQTPYKITLGGIAGIAFLLEEPTHLPQGVWMLIINGVLLVLGLIILGKQCTLKTIFCTALYTGIINLLELTGKHFPVILEKAHCETMLALVYAILLFGFGGAFVFNCGASSGGTDIIALIFKKFTHLNVGFALFIVDFAVICITIMSVEESVVMYSFMGLFAKTFLLDSVIEGLGRTKYITIITTKPDEIGKYIVEKVHHGYTIYEARGGYTGEQKHVILTICKRSEAWKLKTKIKQIDPASFVIISNANEIVGKGFGGTV